MKKLKFTNSPNWSFHRNGWNYVVDHLRNNLHGNDGLLFYDWVDGEFREQKSISKNWAGILHNTITHPAEYYKRKDIRILCLQDLVHQKFFRDSMLKCKFLLTLSPTTAKYLNSQGFEAYHVYHPCPKTFEWMRFDGRVVSLGQWLRKIESISKLKTKYEKIIVKVPWDSPYTSMKLESDVKILNYLDNKKYDELISTSIVFLNMHDVAASNTILECIMSNTPLLINRISGAEDYLGKNYPFFYDSLEQASNLITEKNVMNCNQYLKNMDKSIFSIQHMINSIKLITNKFCNFHLKLI